MTLKNIVFDLLKKGKCTDQNIVNEYGKLPSLNTIENYKYQYQYQKLKKEKKI